TNDSAQEFVLGSGAGIVSHCAMPKLIAGSKATTIQDPNLEQRSLESQVRTFGRWALINLGVAATGSTLALATPAMERLLLQRDPLAFASLTHMGIYSASVIAAAGIGVNCTKRMDRIRSGEEAEYIDAQDSLPWYSRYWKKLTRNAIFPAIALVGLGAGMIRQSTAYYMRYNIVKAYEMKLKKTEKLVARNKEINTEIKFFHDYMTAKRLAAELSGKPLSAEESTRVAQEGTKAYQDYKAGKIPYPEMPEKPKKFNYLLEVDEILHPVEYLFSPPGTAKLWNLKQYFVEYGEKVDENVGRELHQLFGQKEAEFFTTSKEMLFGEVELLMALYHNLGDLDKLNKKMPLSVSETVKEIESKTNQTDKGKELQEGEVYDPLRPDGGLDVFLKERLVQSFLKPLSEKLNESHGNLEDALASFVYTAKEIEAAKVASFKEPIACVVGRDEKRCDQSSSQQYDFYSAFLPDESKQKARLKEGLRRSSFVWKVLSEATALRRYHQALHNMRQQNENRYLKISSLTIPQQSTGVTYIGEETASDYAEQKAKCLQEFRKTSMELRIGNKYNTINPGQHTSLYVSEHEHVLAVPPQGKGLMHFQLIVIKPGQPTPVTLLSPPKEKNLFLIDSSFSVPDLGLEVG
ncbi:MAG: hypothetical protein AABY26_05500, partial [Nanoarchaeota archaeon]